MYDPKTKSFGPMKQADEDDREMSDEEYERWRTASEWDAMDYRDQYEEPEYPDLIDEELEIELHGYHNDAHVPIMEASVIKCRIRKSFLS